MSLVLLLLAIGCLTFGNGANDNFKGVATLYGSGAASFRTALSLATGATVLGAAASAVLAGRIAAAFSGSGLIPEAVAGTPPALLAVAAAGAATILAATRLGMPTSTTHALTGALIGTGVAAGHGGPDFGRLWDVFLQPLLLGPLLAIAGAGLLCGLAKTARRARAADACACLQAPSPAPAPGRGGTAALALPARLGPVLVTGDAAACDRAPGRTIARLDAGTAVHALHFASAGAVCFARALNDTPKIAALMIGAGAWSGRLAAPLIAIAMAAGGLLAARRVAETMSRRITVVDPGPGVAANLVTSTLVLGASSFGLPVSTTHVACGALFGIGLSGGSRDWRVISGILAAWLLTLPAGALFGMGLYAALAAAGGS